MGLNGNDTHDELDNHDLFHHRLYQDFRDKNHIAFERAVPELLGEFDDAWSLPEQLSYVLASLRRLARDQNILNHEFDSVADGLLQVINKILNEFSKEITDEINRIWVEINKLFQRDVTMTSDNTLSFTKTGNWQEDDKIISFKGVANFSTLTESVAIPSIGTFTLPNANKNKTGFWSPDYTQFLTKLQQNITDEATTRHNDDVTEKNAREAQDKILQQHIDAEAKTRGDADKVLQQHIDAEAKTRGDKDTDLQNQINKIKVFTDKLIDNLNQSGAYSGTKADYTQGAFVNHIAYGNINVYGMQQDGAQGIFTAKTSPNRSLAVGV